MCACTLFTFNCIFDHGNDFFSKNYSIMVSINSHLKKKVANMNKKGTMCLKVLVFLTMGMIFFSKNDSKIGSINSHLKKVGNMNKNAHKYLKVFVSARTFCFKLYFWPWEWKRHQSIAIWIKRVNNGWICACYARRRYFPIYSSN